MRTVAAVLLGLSLAPCDGGASDETRQAQLTAQREEKALALQPEKRHPAEKALLWIQEKKIREKLETPGAGFHGIRPKFGSLATGSGFAVGFQYDRLKLLDGNMDFSFSASTSTRWYQSFDAKFELPRLWDERLFVTADVAYKRFPQEDFFGIGPDSSGQSRTDYLYEEFSPRIAAGLRPLPWLRLGSRAGYIRTNVGTGTDGRFPDTDSVFTEADAPGINEQGSFLQGEIYSEIDTRDFPGNPRRGSFLRVGLSAFDDVRLNRYGFKRYEAQAQQYVPFNHGHRVLALRLGASFDVADDGQEVPFYLMKPLGGSNDLRGFRESRFRDANQMFMSIEYRWETWVGLDMALFVDAGKVFSEASEFGLNELESDVGIGFRFNVEKSVFWRVDIARSHEGTRVFFKFSHVF